MVVRETANEAHIRKLHQRWSWWDAVMIPAVATAAPATWQADARHKRSLVPLFEQWIASNTDKGPIEAAPYVPHAFACLYSWPDYLNPLDVTRIAMPAGTLAGLDGFEHVEPDDKTPFPHFVALFALVAAVSGGPPSERRAYNECAPYKARSVADRQLARLVHPSPVQLRSAPRTPDAFCLQTADLADSGLEPVEIAARLGLAIEAGRSSRRGKVAPRSRAAERAIRRGRQLREIPSNN